MHSNLPPSLLASLVSMLISTIRRIVFLLSSYSLFFFLNSRAPPEISPLSLPDAFPISPTRHCFLRTARSFLKGRRTTEPPFITKRGCAGAPRSSNRRFLKKFGPVVLRRFKQLLAV